MLNIKCKVMLNVTLYLITYFMSVYSNDIKNSRNFRTENNQWHLEDLCKTIFNKLNKKEGYTVSADDKIFYLNICGNAPQCGTNITVCYKSKNHADNINNIELKNINFVFEDEEIKHKMSKKKKLKITFICDRHLNKANITFEKIGIYHLKFESSVVCYPKPTQYLFKAKGASSPYDISFLASNNNNWDVRNVPKNYKIYLNIGGKLNSLSNIKSNSDCSYEGTQICLVYNNGSSKNLGVFSDPLLIDDDRLLLNINGGSLCDHSNSITTNIEFICSVNELGPVLTSSTKCSFNIKWATPTACPHIVREIIDCTLPTPMFERHQMKFQSNTIQLNASHFIKYNICDSFYCNGNKQTHFCLISNNSNKGEIVLGSSNNIKNKRLTSYDGLLRATFYGDKCASNPATEYRVYLRLNCDYTRNKQPDVKISGDRCSINITVYTRDVCRVYEPEILDEQCSTFTNVSGIISYYNISGLTLTDRNYEIRDPNNPDLVFVLNVCQPIVFHADTHCDPTANVCMRNDSIGNIYQKSKSLGHYSSSKLIVAQNDSLLMRLDGFGYCPFTSNSYFANIEFICNYKKGASLPVFLSNTDCEYYFQWETIHACPLTINNTLQMKDNRIYKEITQNVETSTIENIIHVTTLAVTSSSTISSTTTTTSSTTPSSTTTSSTTPSSTTTTTSPIPSLTSNSLIVPMNIEVSNTSELFIRDCSIQDFNMNNLPKAINVTSNSGRIYSLKLCNRRKREDCKLGNCLSNLKKGALNNSIEMDFYGKTNCRDIKNEYFRSVVYIKCSEKEPSKLSILKEERCGVYLEWKNSAVCALLQGKPNLIPSSNKIESPVNTGHNMATIISSVFALLLILCVSVLITLYFWRKRQVDNSPSCLTRCDYNRIKDAAKIV